MSPPTASTSSAISRAVRSGVPLKSRCSRKCEIPDCSGVSSREPVPTQTPTHSEATSGIASVTSLMPLASVVVVITSRRLPARALPSGSAQRPPLRGRRRAVPGPPEPRRPPLSGLRRGPPPGAPPARSAGPRLPKVDSSSVAKASSKDARRRVPPVSSPSRPPLPPPSDRPERLGALSPSELWSPGPSPGRLTREGQARPCPAGRSRRRGPRPPGRG